MAILLVREIVKKEIEVPGLGGQIKAAQIASGLSVEKVIRGVDISRTYWNKMVADQDGMVISSEMLGRLEAFLKVDFGVKFDT